MANRMDFEIGDEIYRLKGTRRAWSTAQREKVRDKLESHGFNAGVDLSGWFASADVADWMTEVDDPPRTSDASGGRDVAERGPQHGS